MIGCNGRVRLQILATAVAAAAQLFLATAPLAEVRLSAGEKAHVEVAGTSLHHAHNEASCQACVSQHILSTAEPGRTARLQVIGSAPHLITTALPIDSRAAWFLAHSRAPPALPA